MPESVPEPSCEAAYVVEVNTGTVIYENSQEKKYCQYHKAYDGASGRRVYRIGTGQPG